MFNTYIQLYNIHVGICSLLMAMIGQIYGQNLNSKVQTVTENLQIAAILKSF